MCGFYCIYLTNHIDWEYKYSEIPLSQTSKVSKNLDSTVLEVLIIKYFTVYFEPGRWVKIDSHQVPTQYFEYFIGKLNVKVNAVRQVCHKAQPSYMSRTRRISYKIYDSDIFLEALDESELVLNTEVLYSGNNPCERNYPATPLSAEEEILKAKQRAHLSGEKRRRPSSKSTLTCGYGEGRATREIEVIWWPDLYSRSEHGQMIIRIFIEKCEF